jgi:hypothetical protein
MKYWALLIALMVGCLPLTQALTLYIPQQVFSRTGEFTFQFNVTDSEQNPSSVLFEDSGQQVTFTPGDSLGASCTLGANNKWICQASSAVVPLASGFSQFRFGASASESASLKVVFDSIAPTISNIVARQSGQTVLISAQVTDSSLQQGVCSGLVSVSATHAGKIVGQQNISGCFIATEFSVAVQSLQGPRASIRISATDALGNTGSADTTVTIDTTPPTLTNVSVVSSDGVVLQGASASGQFAKIRFVSDAVSATGSVDGSDVILAKQGQFFESSEFIVTGGKPLSIKILASDFSANTKEFAQTIPISADEAPPIVESVTTSIVVQGVSYSGASGVLTAKIRENGALGAIYASFNGAFVQQATCVKKAVYECSWPLSHTQSQNVSVVLSGSDGANNVVQSNKNPSSDLSYWYVVDLTPPVVQSMSVKTDAGSGIVQSFGRAQVSAVVMDDSQLRMSGNFSVLGGSVDKSVCTASNCSLTSSPLGLGYASFQIPITFSDVVNNSITVLTDPITVLKTSNSTNITYFTSSVLVSPKGFESSSSTYVSQKGYAKISIGPQSGMGAAQVLRVGFSGLSSCKDARVNITGADARNYYSGAKISSVIDVSTIVLQFDVKAVPLKNASVALVCPITVTGRYQDTYIASEVKYVKIDFGTYELSVGTIGDNYQKELAKARQEIDDDIMTKLQTFKKLFDVASKLCRVFNAVTGIMHMLGISSSFTGKAAKATFPFGASLEMSASAYCVGSETAKDGVKLTLRTAAKAFCHFINCEWSLSGYLMSGLGVIDAKKGADSGWSWENGYNSAQSIIGDELFGSNRNTVSSTGSSGQQLSATKITTAESLAGLSKADANSNLVWAVLNLCIPAIFEHLEQAREIKCQYYSCLKNDVPKGVPKYACDAARDYAECKFVYGNLLNALPWVMLWNWITNFIKSIISNPFALAGALLTLGVCKTMCAPGAVGTPPHDVCLGLVAIAEVGALVSNVMAIINAFEGFSQAEKMSYCANLDSPSDGGSQ